MSLFQFAFAIQRGIRDRLLLVRLRAEARRRARAVRQLPIPELD